MHSGTGWHCQAAGSENRLCCAALFPLTAVRALEGISNGFGKVAKFFRVVVSSNLILNTYFITQFFKTSITFCSFAYKAKINCFCSAAFMSVQQIIFCFLSYVLDIFTYRIGLVFAII